MLHETHEQERLRAGLTGIRLEMPNGHRPYWRTLEDTYLFESDLRKLFALAGIEGNIRVQRQGRTVLGNGTAGIFLGAAAPFSLEILVQSEDSDRRDVWQWIASDRDMVPWKERLADALKGKAYVPVRLPEPPPKPEELPQASLPKSPEKPKREAAPKPPKEGFLDREPLGVAYCLAMLLVRADELDLVLKEDLTDAAQEFFVFPDRRKTVPLHKGLVARGYLLRMDETYRVCRTKAAQYVSKHIAELAGHSAMQEKLKSLGKSSRKGYPEMCKRLQELLRG